MLNEIARHLHNNTKALLRTHGDIRSWMALYASETVVWIEVPVPEPARTPLFTLAYSVIATLQICTVCKAQNKCLKLVIHITDHLVESLSRFNQNAQLNISNFAYSMAMFCFYNISHNFTNYYSNEKETYSHFTYLSYKAMNILNRMLQLCDNLALHQGC